MSKKSYLDAARTLFDKKKVLGMKELCVALSTSSRTTAFRYLRELNHVTSYTHNGKYYTLPEIAQFDSNGFWHFGEIGFSIHGTLIDTLHHVINQSASGKSNSELEKHCRARVQAALRTLLQSRRIVRVKPMKRHLYVSADPAIRDHQIGKRTEVGPRKRLPDWIVAEILVETIRSCPVVPSIEDISGRLAKRGSTISWDQVGQVFEEYELEKKTPD